MSQRLVICDACGCKYKFAVPAKAGVFRLKCPKCFKSIVFKVAGEPACGMPAQALH